jgi:two-component system NtrC family sensor kinase
MRVPIRFKILISTLVVLTTVLGLITFTMARLFHDDKEAYIRDLTSVVAQHTGEEARDLLRGYGEKLRVFARMAYQTDLSKNTKAKLIADLFKDFGDFVSITIYDNGIEQITLYDRNAFKGKQLDQKALNRYRKEHPLPLKLIDERKEYIENSTIIRDLPLLTIAVKPELPDNKSVVIAAVVRMDRLHSISGRSRVLETFILSKKGGVVSHADLSLVAARGKADWIPSQEINANIPVVGTTINYNHGDVEMIGSLFKVGFGNLVAVAEIPASSAFLSTRELLNNLMIVALALLSFFTLVTLFWSRRLTRPIEILSRAAKYIGAGKFNIMVNHASKDEMGDLAKSFNVMAAELKNRADALEDAQNALVHSEKMSAFGQMSAGIAHEVKNPLAGILGYVQLSKRKLDPDHPIIKNLDIIEKETRRCTDIVSNLMRFARQEKVEYVPLDVNKVVEEALDIVDHQLGIKHVKIEKVFEHDLPQIRGDANQLQQVLMNFAINSQQAMEETGGGVFRATTRRGNKGFIEIIVHDTGPGIPEEIQDQIFEPFFTTKRAGEGTGLGLAVTYGIIKEHGGDIRVRSKAGNGTTFIISLPVSTGRKPGTG